jgi:hypothetical protein
MVDGRCDLGGGNSGGGKRNAMYRAEHITGRCRGGEWVGLGGCSPSSVFACLAGPSQQRGPWLERRPSEPEGQQPGMVAPGRVGWNNHLRIGKGDSVVKPFAMLSRSSPVLMAPKIETDLFTL